MIGKPTVKERTLQYLQEMLSDVFRAIEQGNAYAIGTFEKEGEEIQPTRLFDTMRYKANLFLKSKGYDLQRLPMNGLHVSYKGYEIKILKCRKDGTPPIAGKSKQRMRFYNHEFPPKLPFFEELNKTIQKLGLEERRELIILYKVSGDGNFIGLELGCTESAENHFTPPLFAWNIVVPHPAKFASNTSKYEEPSKDVRTFDDGDEQDLDIFQDGTN